VGVGRFGQRHRDRHARAQPSRRSLPHHVGQQLAVVPDELQLLAHPAGRNDGRRGTGRDHDSPVPDGSGRRLAEGDRVEHRSHRPDRGQLDGTGDHLVNAEAVHPRLVAVAGLRQDTVAAPHGELGGETADTATGTGDQNAAAGRQHGQ
jgi:hypothetical protein